MSDGDNATPGQNGADGEFRSTRTPRPRPGAAPWERPSARRAAAAESARETRKPPPSDDGSGQHTGGTGPTVADLIAKVNGDQEPSSRHRAAVDPPTIVQPAVVQRRGRVRPRPELADAPVDYPRSDYEPPSDYEPSSDYELPSDYEPVQYDYLRAERRPALTPEDVTAPMQAAFASELPDLEAAARRKRAAQDVSAAEETTVLPPVTDKAPPKRVGRYRPATRGDHPHSRRRAIIVGRVATALFAVLALALTGGAWQWTSSKNSSLNNVNALDQDSRDIIDPGAQYGDENFLIVGVDSRAGANSEIGAGDESDAGGARSDTVILVNIPANRKRVVAVSFPRDLSIDPMECEAWNPNTGEYGPIWDEDTQSWGPEEWYTETKLNSAYSYGGPKCLVKVVQKISGLSINRFMAVDFVGFSKVVDALGGVEVCSTTPIEDYELGTVLANPGRQMINGQTALNYVRARQVTTEINGDYGRIKRQQLFLSSLLRSMISTDTFFSLSKLNNVVNMFIGDTTVDNVDTKDLVNLGQSLQNVAAGRITFVTVPTVGYADEAGNEVPRTDDIRALFDAIINDDPLPGEENADGTPTAASATPESTTSPQESPGPPPAELMDAVTTEPTDVTVHVSNSTAETGLATTAADELQQHGFNVTLPDDYPSSLDTTTVFYSPGNEEAAVTVASSFVNPHVEKVTGMGQVVQVVLGSDFYSVNAPQPSGSPMQVEVTPGSYHSTPTPLPDDLTVTNAADTTCE